MKKKELGDADRPRLPARRQQGDGHLRRPAEGPRLRASPPRRHLDRHQGHGDPGRRRRELLDEANGAVREIEDQYNKGLITDGERYNKVIDIWAEVTDRIADEMLRELGTEDDAPTPRARCSASPSLQPDLHDGRLGRARLARSRSASSPACAA